MNQNEFKGWAKVEVMGHQSHIGFVTTETYGQAVMFRIDQPEIPEEETTLEETTGRSGVYYPAGSVVKSPAIEPVSVLVGSGSIYRIIPCTEAVALKAVRENQRKPLVLVRLPENVALTGKAVFDDSESLDFEYDNEASFDSEKEKSE